MRRSEMIVQVKFDMRHRLECRFDPVGRTAPL